MIMNERLQEGLLSLLSDIVKRIKDELLLFAVFAILLILIFEDQKVYIFILFCLGSIAYLVKRYLNIRDTKVNNRHFENFAKFAKNKSDWEKRAIDEQNIYFYKEDNNYKIEQDYDSRNVWERREPWMSKFPDGHVTQYKVYLKYGETKIGELQFVSCDGARYFIPLPERRFPNQDTGDSHIEYYWVKNSLYYQVGEIVGDLYREIDLAGVAKFCGIEILE